jgi:reprolysin-like metallo-peptidase family M12B
MGVAPLALAVALLLSWLPWAEPAAASPAALFDAPANVRTAAPGVGAWSRVTVRQRRATARLDLLTRSDGSPALTAGERVHLNLFDDAAFTMSVTEVTRHGTGGLSWSGTLDGTDPGYAVLAVHDGALAGHVSVAGAVYRIGYTPAGAPVVEEIDTSAFPPEDHPAAPSSADDADTPDTPLDSASQVDVMVLYTASARIRQGGTAAIRAEATLAVAVTNQGYANNDLVQRLRIVYVGETPIVETPNINTALNLVRADPTVAALRNLVRADLVSLIVDNGDNAIACGIGFLMVTNSVAFAPNGFSVVERECATGNLSFAHELGHNMGSHHDPLVSVGEPTLALYGHGFVDVVGKFRTIMAYNDQCVTAGFNCTRIPYFSSPNKMFNGRTVGNAATSDNARSLSETGGTVSSFRTALTSPLALVAGVNQLTFAVGQTLVASVSLNHPGGVAGSFDLYVGLMLPNGSAVFFTSAAITATSGYALGTLANVSSYRPIASGIPLSGPLTANVGSFLSYPRQAGDPTGGLAFFVLAVRAGALADGVLATDELLSASFAPFTFPATSPGDSAP